MTLVAVIVFLLLRPSGDNADALLANGGPAKITVLKDDRIHVTVGAGIVARSVPENEFEETEHKAGAIRRALEMAVEEAGAAAGDGRPVGVGVGVGAGPEPQEASR